MIVIFQMQMCYVETGSSRRGAGINQINFVAKEDEEIGSKGYAKGNR